jgi:MFS transporter, Spinster family, sphingosine-1-phosphate transporter
VIKNRTAIVALLTGLNFLNYLDRFIVAAVLPRIQDELHLSNFEGGLLATVFLLGYFATSPLFGNLGDKMSRKVLIAIGVATWSAATVASGLAQGLVPLLLARVVVGVGEASYATLAPTIIDDITPPERKGKTLAIFFLAVPVGSALGYLVGGFVEHRWGWRAAFFVGGGPGLVLALTCLAIVEPTRTLAHAKQSIAEGFATLVRLPLYRRAVLGYCAHTWAIGGFAYWAPKFLNQHYQLELRTADFWFGVVTVVAGAIGTFVGGAMADRALRGLPEVPADASHTSRANRLAANAQLRVCAIGVAIAAPLAALCFVMPSAAPFFVIAGACEVGLFLSASPINAIMLRTAPAHLRATAMAVGIFAIHLLGDLWSPPVIGIFLDVLPIVLAMMALPIAFALAAATWWPRAREAE